MTRGTTRLIKLLFQNVCSLSGQIFIHIAQYHISQICLKGIFYLSDLSCFLCVHLPVFNHFAANKWPYLLITLLHLCVYPLVFIYCLESMVCPLWILASLLQDVLIWDHCNEQLIRIRIPVQIHLVDTCLIWPVDLNLKQRHVIWLLQKMLLVHFLWSLISLSFNWAQVLFIFSLFIFTAWCLRSEGVSSVLLGVSNTDQLLENLGALRVEFLFPFFLPHQ